MNYRRNFIMQRSNAKYRNIEWNLTFNEWLEWWGDDIVNRGRGKGKLNMGRYGDTGSYSLDNIYKILCEDNTRDAHKDKKRSESHIHKLTNHLSKVRIQHPVMTPYGEFKSPYHAGRKLDIHPTTVRWRIKQNKEGWYYV